jgi:hypothetical protein
MAAYTAIGPGVVQRTADGAFIPADPANSDYRAYLEWTSSGNSPGTPPPPPPPTTLTPYEFLERFTPSEQLAVQTVCSSNMTLLVGLTTGIASGSVSLSDPNVVNWVNGLVTAGAITSARATAILTP